MVFALTAIAGLRTTFFQYWRWEDVELIKVPMLQGEVKDATEEVLHNSDTQVWRLPVWLVGFRSDCRFRRGCRGCSTFALLPVALLDIAVVFFCCAPRPLAVLRWRCCGSAACHVVAGGHPVCVVPLPVLWCRYQCRGCL